MKLTRLIVLCTGLIALAATSTFSQTPTSGALLTITGNAGSAVNINIYDSQIHSGLVQAVPVGGGSSCNSTDATFPTDAYVLQGGSWTGCDAGDAFEVTENNGNAGHQAFGHADIGGFHIETHYVCGGACSGNIAQPGPVCNTSGTICANPDTGFLTVTNNTGAAFTGTITLQGTSPIGGGSFCAVNGAALDTWTSGLTTSGAGQSVTLALGTQGTVDSPGASDSSNCGGFSAPQTMSLAAGTDTKFPIGGDAYEITPFNSAVGDHLVVLPVPVPSNQFSAPNFPGQKCIPYASTSAPPGSNVANPVCVELQVTCPVSGCSDGGNFLYTAQADYTVDPVSLPNGIGGPAFLGQHTVNCPTTGFNLNIFLSYTADPTKGSGAGTGSCYVATYNPTAPLVAPGATVSSFVGFQSPVDDNSLNVIKAGSTVPLKWQQFNSDQTPLTNLSWCQVENGDGTCTPAVPTPWVFLGQIGINCQTDQGQTADTGITANSGFQNLGNGSYQFNWKTAKSATGCATVVLQYDSGLTVFPANFKYH
jgi:hypothetical protein